MKGVHNLTLVVEVGLEVSFGCCFSGLRCSLPAQDEGCALSLISEMVSQQDISLLKRSSDIS